MSVFEILTVVAYVLGAIVSFVLKEKADELARQGCLLYTSDAADE